MTAKRKPLTLYQQRGRQYEEAVKFGDNTAPIIPKMEDFTMSMFHFTCVAPFVLWCLIGAVASWKNL